MDFKDYYAALGVPPTATQDEIKRAYRKLARKYHPDVSKEADAEARFKDVAEAHEALIDPERRAAYDDLARKKAKGESFEPPPGWNTGYEFRGRGAREASPHDAAEFSDFFESLFGRAGPGEGAPRPPHRSGPQRGEDHHAKVMIDLEDAYLGARRTISLRVPVADAEGRVTLHDRQLEVGIPKGVRAGQQLRLAAQGGAGFNGGPAGDLYLEMALRPHPAFRLDGVDVYTDLTLAPWEAALGASVTARTPEGAVQLTVPAGSVPGRKLRLKGKGLPAKVPGDLYVVLTVALPPASTPAAQAAYAELAKAFVDFDPRREREAPP